MPKRSYFKTIHEIIVAGHSLTDQAHTSLKELGSTEPQYNVLRILYEHDEKPLSLEEIQSHMVQRSSNVSRIVDKLRAKKYVERHECKLNRRKKEISLTKAGRQYLKSLDKRIYELHKPFMEVLTEDEHKLLRELILKLCDR